MRRKVAKYFHDAVAEELAKSGRYEIVTIPGPDVLELNVTEQARAKTLQGQIWSETVAASALPGVRPDAARFRKESR